MKNRVLKGLIVPILNHLPNSLPNSKTEIQLLKYFFEQWVYKIYLEIQVS